MLRFIDDHLPTLRPEAATRYQSSIKALLRHMGKGRFPLTDIGPERLSDFVTARRTDGVSDTAVRRDIACLSSILSSAVGWGWLPTNPVRDWKKRSLKPTVERTRFLTRTEYRTALKAAGDLRPIVVIAVETGMRIGEILALEWRDVDYKNLAIHVRQSKTGKPRTVPMSETAAGTFRAQKNRGTPWVFSFGDGRPRQRSDVSRLFSRRMAKAGLQDLRFHDLRHTFASWKVQEGFDLYRIQRILGHTGPQMTQRYAHLRTDDLMEVVSGKRAHLRAHGKGTLKRKT